MTVCDGFLLKPAKLFDGSRIRSDLLIKVTRNGFCHLVKNSESGGVAPKIIDGILSVGFVDLQVNGGGGVLFNTDPTPETLKAILAAHRRFGSVAILPTVITDAKYVLEKAVEAVIESKHQPGIIGIHIEGPHIALEQRGAHAARFVRLYDPGTFQLVQNLRLKEIPVMITLAPEVVSMKDIEALSETGAIVSLGHTNASLHLANEALSHGACAFTHLFNAMPAMRNRKPGIVAAALNSDCYTSIIGDGFHVDDEILKFAIRARPVKDRLFIVSDAMPTIGGPSSFKLYGSAITLKKGRLINSEGKLAGAHITMAGTVKRFVSALGVAIEDALKMAISVPANLINRPDLASLENRHVKDLICLDDDLNFERDLMDII
ncbi:MAG: N-acetylglucosamine-6-phosphate deacetylase [Rhodobacteraceae bacterium]|nr:N-acetylglucosamine-6-phosphate deacetylase [Paracoccaceae bacterium]